MGGDQRADHGSPIFVHQNDHHATGERLSYPSRPIHHGCFIQRKSANGGYIISERKWVSFTFFASRSSLPKQFNVPIYNGVPVYNIHVRIQCRLSSQLDACTTSGVIFLTQTIPLFQSPIKLP